MQSKKLKIAIISIIPVVVVGLTLTGYLVYRTIKQGNERMANIKPAVATEQSKDTSKQENQKVTPVKNTEKAPVKTETQNKTETKTVVQATTSKESEANLNNHTVRKPEPAAKLSKYESIFVTQFSPRTEYPQILKNQDDNLVKIFSTYSLDYLNAMKTLSDNTVKGTTPKANYYTDLEIAQEAFSSLTGTLDQVIAATNGPAKVQAQNLRNIVNAEALKMKAQFSIIKNSPTFGTPMINSLPFGSSLDEAIKTVEKINNDLGCNNQKALDSFKESYKLNLPN